MQRIVLPGIYCKIAHLVMHLLAVVYVRYCLLCDIKVVFVSFLPSNKQSDNSHFAIKRVSAYILFVLKCESSILKYADRTPPNYAYAQYI